MSVVLIGVLFQVSVQEAAASTAERRAGRVRATVATLQVGRDTQVAVKLRNNTIVVGHLAGAGEHSFLVTDPETQVSTQVAYRNVQTLNATSTGARVGIAVAVAGVIALVAWLAFIGTPH